MKNSSKYKRQYFLPPVKCMDWTEKDHVEKAPIWCSVDLRDGNQALVIPMNLEQKVEFFKLLVEIGFKEDAFSPIVWKELPESESWFTHG